MLSNMVSEMAEFEQPIADHWPQPPARYQAAIIVVIVVIVALLPILFH